MACWAYTAGLHSNLAGLSLDDNPHFKGSELWLQWRAGWSYGEVNIRPHVAHVKREIEEERETDTAAEQERKEKENAA